MNKHIRVILSVLISFQMLSSKAETQATLKLAQNSVPPLNIANSKIVPQNASNNDEVTIFYKKNNLPAAKTSTSATKAPSKPTVNRNNNKKTPPVKKVPTAPSIARKKISPAKKPKSQPKSEEDKIFLSFENAELINFTNYIADLKKWNLIPDKTMTGNKISLSVRTPVTIDKAEKIFYTVLDKAGYALIQEGEVYKIVTKDKRTREPLPAYINVDSKDLPNSDITLRYVAFLENIKIQDVGGLLRSMLDPTAMVLEQPDANCVIIADKSYNIKAAMKIIQELDKTGLKETAVVMRLKYANAIDVQDLFKSLIEEKQDSNPLARLLGKKAESTTTYFSPSTRIIAEERTNSLVLLGTRESIEKIVKFIQEHVDTELKEVESPLHIYELQYADAKQMASLLNEVTTIPESLAGQSASKFGAVRGGVKYFKKMVIQADVQGNRLLVSSSDRNDWKLLKQTIRDLDKPQPQIGIETLIVTVDIEDDRELGGYMRNKKPGELGTGVDAQTASLNGTVIQQIGDVNVSILGNLISNIVGNLGSTVLTFGRQNNVWAVFQTLKAYTHSTLVAQPFLTITNKYKAQILVGDTKRVITQTTTTDIEGFTNQEANLEIDIKPQINVDGIINLDIKVEFDQFTDPTGLNTINRTVDTNVAVADGQVLVLGGLVKNQVSETEYKTPILGDIPGLGWFFKQKIKQIIKQSLLVFISPVIIKPRESMGIGLYTQMKLETAKEGIEAATIGASHDPVHNWFFNPEQTQYSYKIDDYSNGRYQPVTVDIKNDPFYRTETQREEAVALKIEEIEQAEEEIEEKLKQREFEKQENLPEESETDHKDITLESKNVSEDTDNDTDETDELSEQNATTNNLKKRRNNIRKVD